MNNEVTPEFSRLIEADRLGAKDHFDVAATEQECAALNARFGLRAIHSLSASIDTKRIAGGPLIRVIGHLVADIVQTCVVTLEPVPEHVEEDFEIVFGPPNLVEEDPGDLMLNMDTEDPAEPIIGGKIDLGEVVAEHLALAMEPFPRAPGAELSAEFVQKDVEEDVAPARQNPFAALAALKDKQKSGD